MLEMELEERRELNRWRPSVVAQIPIFKEHDEFKRIACQALFVEV